MANLNKVIISGRIGKDADLTKKENISFTKFSVATNEEWIHLGQKHSATTWHTVICFGELATACSALKKGNEVYIEGKLSKSMFADEFGKKRVSTNIVANSVSFIGGMAGDKL